MKPLRVPTSSYAAMAAHRRYYARNRAAYLLCDKMRAAGKPISMQKAREMLAQSAAAGTS